MRYEVLEHTADVGIRAYGDDVNEIFENAAHGMFDLMTDISRVRAVGEVHVSLDAPDLGALLVDWLSELLFLHERDHAFFSAFDVRLEGMTLEAKVRGEEVDTTRHRQEQQVKAVTYHMLEVNPEEGYAVVIFDI